MTRMPSDKDIPLAERQAMAPQEKIRQVQKYLHDLTFVAPEIFPTGQQVHYRVGQILGMWK